MIASIPSRLRQLSSLCARRQDLVSPFGRILLLLPALPANVSLADLMTIAVYFAFLVFCRYKGMGTNDDLLIRCVVSRCEVDMVEIKQSYQQTYGKTLKADIEVSDCFYLEICPRNDGSVLFVCVCIYMCVWRGGGGGRGEGDRGGSWMSWSH